MANVLWGKLSELSSKTNWTYVSEVEAYLKLMTDDSIVVSDVSYVSDSVVGVQWAKRKAFEECLPTNNIVISCFTTAHARLKLYDVMSKLGARNCYHDTDSIIYLHRDGEWEPPTSSYLGELKDELSGDHIVEYVAGGPKNYSYKVSSGATVTKIRGFTLNHRTSKALNFDALKQVVSGGFGEKIKTVNPTTFIRDGVGGVFTRETEKVYALSFDKRLIAPDGVSTYPFGWIGEFDQL